MAESDDAEPAPATTTPRRPWRLTRTVSAARDTYVFIQIGLPAATPDEVTQRLLDSLDVLPGNLPLE